MSAYIFSTIGRLANQNAHREHHPSNDQQGEAPIVIPITFVTLVPDKTSVTKIQPDIFAGPDSGFNYSTYSCVNICKVRSYLNCSSPDMVTF